MVKSAPEIEREVRALLSECSLAAQGLYLQMRYAVEDIFAASTSPEDAGTIPEELPRQLAGRESGRTPVILSQLLAANLVTANGDGLSLPHVVRIHRVKINQRHRKTRERAHGCDVTPTQGVTSHPATGSISYPKLQVRANNEFATHEAVAMGCDVTPSGGVTSHPLPPQVSSPPITPSSSFPSPHTHTGGGTPENREAVSPEAELDSRIRGYIGGHRMLTFSPKALAICREMVASGGWTGMVQAIDAALAQGVAEPFSYAKKVMAGEQARTRLRIDQGRSSGGVPASQPPRKIVHGSL